MRQMHHTYRASRGHLCSKIATNNTRRYLNVDVFSSNKQKADSNIVHDLICIGGGSGGLSASKRANMYIKEQTGSFGNVSLIDSRPKTEQQQNLCKPSLKWGLGGTCVNVGCIPKKIFHASSLMFESVYSNDLQQFGLTNAARALESSQQQQQREIDWQLFTDNVMNYIKSINFGYRGDLRSANVDIVSGMASFVDNQTIQVTLDRGDGKQKKLMRAKNFVIAVGGAPTLPDIPGAEYAITSDEIFALKEPPGKTLVVGAGYIALECAGFLTGMGFPTTVMYRSVPLRSFDQECASFVVKHMEHSGTRIMAGKVISRIEKNEQTGKLRVWYTGTREQPELANDSEEFDTVLYAIGRNSSKQCQSLDLDKAGVVWDQNTGKVVTNDEDQTSASNIYAIGDCAQSPAMNGFVSELTPVAIQAGKYLAGRLFGNGNNKVNYSLIPTSIFTPVEYACVGLSEEQAIQLYGEDNLEVYHLHYNSVEQSFLKRESNMTFMKMICLKTDNERVIGFHFCGQNAGEMIHGVALAMKTGATKKDYDEMIGIHPTAAEEMFALQVTKRSGLPAEKHGC